MTEIFPTRYYFAFGRTIGSEVPLPLLTEVDQVAQSDVAARVVVSDTAMTPSEEAISGDRDQPVTMHRDGDQVLIAMNRLGWLGRLREAPTTITLHPDGRQPSTHSLTNPENVRVLGDRVVTNVLPYLPQLWGHFGIHGAFLDTPAGAVMLLAPSGSGKSTLSHVLAREHGWRILDDDTSMVTQAEPYCALIPMGAQSRLRKDAAEYLGIKVAGLDSYGGHKGLALGDVPTPVRDERVLQAFVTLSPDDSDSSDPAERNHPELNRMEPIESMHSIFESLFSLAPDNRGSIQSQLSLSATLAPMRHWRVRYRKGQHSPEDTASAIAAALKGMSSNK